MKKGKFFDLGGLINRAQSTFVGFLRIWSIPIVIGLSIASGYTTYYGMSHFITPWIALIITVAVQSIIVICSLELAGIRWRANPPRYLSVILALAIAITASITFSYFKFYEISQSEAMRLARLGRLQDSLTHYLTEVQSLRSRVIAGLSTELDAAQREATAAYLGTHPDTPEKFRNLVGKGPIWEHFQALRETARERVREAEQRFAELDKPVNELRQSVHELTSSGGAEQAAYQRLVGQHQRVQTLADDLASIYGVTAPLSTPIRPYADFSKGIEVTFDMWRDFSWFAFACAAMVDFFTLLLSYRLEFTAPGPLSAEEQRLAYACIKQFGEVRINGNDELELMIQRTDLERARRYPDRMRLFGVGFLLSRGYLRKVDGRSVEFAPNLYPIIAEQVIAELAARPVNETAQSS